MDEQNLPHPDHWSGFEILMDADGHGATMMIVADDGTEYELIIDQIDLYDLDSWDYVWDIWDWLIQNWPDVDLVAKYGGVVVDA